MGSPGAYTLDGYLGLGSLDRLHRDLVFFAELFVSEGSSALEEAADISVDVFVVDLGDGEVDRLPTVKVRFSFSRKGILEVQGNTLDTSVGAFRKSKAV